MIFLGRVRKKRKGLQTSMRFEIIDGTYRLYPDGRQVCLDTDKGQAEYKRRTLEMAERQNWICIRNPHRIDGPTFDHANGRGAGKQDDRIWDEFGRPMNGCSCWLCNGMAGSKRF